MVYEIEVLECNSGVSKKGNAYNVLLARVEGRVGKLFSDVGLPLGAHRVEIQIAPNAEMFLTPRVKGVEGVRE